MPVVEILVNIPAVANLIREGKSHQIATMMQTGRPYGMMTFEAAIQDLTQKETDLGTGRRELPAPPRGRQIRGGNSFGPVPAYTESSH